MKANKQCTRCSIDKPISEYSGHPSALDGRQSQCKACCAERARLRRASRPYEGCGESMASSARKRAKRCDKCLSLCRKCGKQERVKGQRICSECSSLQAKEYRADPLNKIKERISRIASRYQINKVLAATLAVFDRCEACGYESKRPGDIHVDHCHATGLVRGSLCFNCNAALGHVNDDISRLQRLVGYLEEKHLTKLDSDLIKASRLLDLLIEHEQADTKTANWPESADARMDIIGQNGPTAEHYAEQAGDVAEPLTLAEIMQQTWFMNSATLEDRDAFIANDVPVESLDDWNVQAGPAICGYTRELAEVCSWGKGGIGRYTGDSEIHRTGNNFYWGAPK